MAKVDDVWANLFSKYNILKHVNEDKVFNITSSDIKHFYEPRLATKFDWSASLPKLFRDNKLAILPTTRGSYSIGHFKAYQSLEVENVKPKAMYLPEWVRTWDRFDITSEAVALNVAKATGMIDEVMGSLEDYPAVDTVTGRLKSGDLNYKIQLRDKTLYDFKVENAQVEIDAGFENTEKLAIVEAKTHIPADFMIRQLYYPYRVYSELGTGKPVIPLYFTYADEVFNFYQFEFTSLDNYSSIKKVAQFSFILDKILDLNMDVVKQISAQSPMNPEPKSFPYPQANTFQMVLDTIKYLEDPKDKYDLAKLFGFDVRQSDYYANCVCFLGLATRVSGKYQLNELGHRINALPNSNVRNELIIKQMLSHVTLKLIFDSYIRNGGKADNAYIDSVLENYVDSISGSTIPRRRSTIKQWISWIFSVID
ncbi:hypothetical protein PND37_14295 [Lactiplantibacillus plantarum]|uniref:type II restriction enzyme n=1 Tax=Lactiplantibacillus plantarum TaxID=1590 RepID=UPI0018974B1F|nr:hypothetical protein [Lactiplantibacillus plantarum]MDB7776095.1 hypothetical protein [Lactiplantibacillus plantarum]QYC99200.1 hypothetical protein HZF13_07160 [Lactiplantibacillus plantarum]